MRITKKQFVHRFYLLFAAITISVGVILGLTQNGYFNYSSLRYFTYLSNILAIIGLLFLFIFYNKKPVINNYVCGSILLAISVTGIIYNFVLVPFSGNEIIISSYINFSNHFLSMFLVLANYFIFEKKGYITVKHLAVGMLFPLFYWLIFVTAGSITNFYPYFFMDIAELGLLIGIAWLFALLGIFIIFGILLITFDHGVGRHENAIYHLYCRIVQKILKTFSPILPWRDPKIISGENSILQLTKLLKELNVQHPIIVTDSTLIKIGLLTPLLNEFDSLNVKYTIFQDVQPNPTINNVENAVNAYRNNNCDCIIAIGGGSVLDCAKVLGARIVKRRKSVSSMAGLFKILKRLPPLIAIPTTAGTGSETTIAAVITDSNTHHKFAINDLSLIPHYAILDPILTLKLPKHLTATTGLDALTHAIEAYIGNSNNKKTIIDAENACRLLKQNLLIAVENGENITARNNVLMASHYAGRAFTRAYVGNVHAIAHTLSGFYDVPHGLANAILLPIVLEYYGSSIYNKLGRIADVMGIGGSNNEEKSKNLILYLKNLNKELDIPEQFNCIKSSDIPLMIKNAFKEANPLYPVPKIFSKRDFNNIFTKIK